MSKDLLPYPPDTLVRIEGIRGVYRIVSGPDSRGNYRVALGEMELHAHTDSITPSTQPPRNRSKTVHRKPQSASQSPSAKSLRVDLHGMTRAEAWQQLLNALNRAVLDNYTQIEVVHGIGTGTLRLLTEEFALLQPAISRCAKVPANPGISILYI